MKFKTSLTLQEIASLVDAQDFYGDDKVLITGINEIHKVEPGDITFVDHPKYYQKALKSKATTVLINERLDVENGKSIIIVNDPLKAYLKIIESLQPFNPSTQMISSTAQVGANSIIQPGVFIGNHVKIGKNCIIHSNVSIYDYTEIGDNVIIHSSSVIGADAYYFQKRQDGFIKLTSCGKVIIKNNVEIGACCTIDRGVSGETIIDDQTKLDNHCQIGHDTYIGKRCLIGAFAAIAGVTKIEDDVILWAQVAVNKDLVIGKGAIVLATSAVDKSLEGGKTYFGTPAEEARKKWREMVFIRRLPELFK